MPKDFAPKAYFYNCFRIIHDADVSPEEMKLKISSDQANYLRVLPHQHLQKEIETA